MDETYLKQATCAAYGWGVPQDWPQAMTLLERAARASEEGAREQFELVSQMPLEQLLSPPQPVRLHSSARIASIKLFAPPGFPEWIIGRSKGRLEAAQMADASGKCVRTATTCRFGPDERDLIIAVLQERAARLLAAPITFHEPPSTIHYEVGQEFRLHADFVQPSVQAYQAELNLLGQRVGTIVTYLNDDFDGAATQFPELSLDFRGDIGEAIFWANVLPDGSPDYRTAHQALAPTRGEKWVLSQWIRAKPIPLQPT